MSTGGGGDTRAEFREVVNMTAAELKKWLDTDTKWRYSLMNWGHDPLK